MTTEEDMLRLMAKVRHLEEANAHETGRANKLAADLASTQANLESLRASIIAACSGTKCLNAHELRFNLDEARQNVKILAAEVRAWRAWWVRCTCTCDECKDAWKRQIGSTAEFSKHHPFPPTIDGAASAMPKGWEWSRLFGFKMWHAARPGPDGRLPDGWEVETPDTGDEIHDRYLLAKLAWEQETRNDGK